VNYDQQRTEGLTDADLIDSISARYGVSILQAASLPTVVPPRHASPDGDAVIARWSDADTSLTLVRGTYPTTLRLVIASKSTEALASNASAEAALALDDAKVSDFEQYRPHVMGALAHQAYLSGDTRTGMLDYGPAAVFADAVESAEAIFDRLIDDARAASRRLGALEVQR